MLSMLKAFPQLSMVPYISLGCFPTPVAKLERVSERCGREIFIKRDDLSGELYGGNKVRKLEFLLGEARRCGADRVITTGGAGSNHALATAVYACTRGFKTTIMLFDQPNSQSVKENLLADLSTGAEMHLDPDYESHRRSLHRIIEKCTKEGQIPYVIAAGGSSPVGTIGFVNAGFELAEQIRIGALPRFPTIFVTLGTMGTAAGLLLGLKVAGVQSRIHAVRVVPKVVANPQAFQNLFRETNELLRETDPTFPIVKIQEGDIYFNNDFFGEGYGIHSPQAIDACQTVLEQESIHLDGTYTGKTFAALLADKEEAPVLFWNTKNSRPISKLVKTDDFTRLPPAFHHYFRKET